MEVDIASGDGETDSDGDFTSTIIIPESTAGKHTITVTDKTGSKAEAGFTMKEEITATPTKGVAGDTVTVNGTGFGKKVNVTIKFDGDELATATTNNDGSFQVTFTLPMEGAGTYFIEAEDEEKNVGKVALTAAAGIKLSQTSGNVGTEVTISGTGFRPNANITISYAPDFATVARITADANGGFSATFKVPKSNAGQHTITATDFTNMVKAMFTMESTPPLVPTPLLPLDGDKAKSPVHFDWGDVPDPSGVTYTLQIATDDKFNAGSMVLAKTGLTKSEYSLTKEERLKSTEKEAPYFWRIQAVDGAGNESGWSTPGPFYVDSTFELTGWILILVGIGGLLGLAIAYLLIRRTT